MASHYPLIGIPCRADSSSTYPGRPINAQNNSYIKAIVQAGGLPILIPVQVRGTLRQALFQQVDGLLFTGGGDIDPAYYNQSPQVDNLDHVQKIRDELEIELMRLAIQARKPFFAICRGIQVMNVAGGGNLWQDLASQVPTAMRHDYFYEEIHFPRNYLAHEVTFDKTSLLGRILKMGRLPVNSLHHQAVKDVPASLRVVGCADDGVIEVLEALDHPFGLGVQWHPEELVAEQEAAREMFSAFVEASRHSRKNGQT